METSVELASYRGIYCPARNISAVHTHREEIWITINEYI
jgi:hypothetical protein